MARQSSRDALNAYRQSQSTETYSRRPPTEPMGSWDGVQRRSPWSTGGATGRYGWQRSLPPAYGGGAQPGYGIWNALFLWNLLESLGRPGHTEFFHHHQDDPGYQAWRAEAEARAKDDPAVRQQLADLDNRLATMQDQPRSRDYLPPDASPQAAYKQPEQDEGEGKTTLFLLLVVCAGVAYLGWRSLSGDIAARKKAMFGKLSSSSPYRPKWFRIGMTLPLDPSLFILAAQSTHIRPPDGLSGSGLVSVEFLGQVQSGEIVWHRLYPQGESCFFQVHLDRHGNPDECRYFSKLDEVTPASEAEWAFWLDETEGQIGWPEFQTKDGELYQRIQSPGSHRVAPPSQQETLITDTGESTRSHVATLYGAATGASEPAPQTEYMLVTAIDDGTRAWVAIYAGVDVSVSSLNLS